MKKRTNLNVRHSIMLYVTDHKSLSQIMNKSFFFSALKNECK